MAAEAAGRRHRFRRRDHTVVAEAVEALHPEEAEEAARVVAAVTLEGDAIASVIQEQGKEF